MTRLQKLLAGAGLGSRRAIEEWIRAGRVTVGGRIAQLGDRAAPSDEVCLDGRKLELDSRPAPAELLLYYKPVGEVTTRRDPQRRPTVFERLPAPDCGRWITVGRLDVNTAGLLLFTTDGELAHRLMHPSGEVEREYLVRVRGRPAPETIERLRQGVTLEDGPARFDRISSARDGFGAPEQGTGHSAYRVVLREGRNREVRRLFEAVGFEVSRLLRIRYGPLGLPRELRPGGSRRAFPPELEALRQAVAGTPPRAAAVPGPRPDRAPGRRPGRSRGPSA
jgi:23S rRNA pseudouridine2605 synthase